MSRIYWPNVFTNSAPLGWDDLVVGMSMYVCIYLYVPFPCNFFQGLSLALRSHDQFNTFHWSTPLPPTWGSSPHWRCSTWGLCMRAALKKGDLWIVLLWSLKNKELFQIGLVDHPRVAGIWLVDCPRMAGVRLVDCSRVAGVRLVDCPRMAGVRLMNCLRVEP